MEAINEKSTAYLTVNFLDKTGAAAVPSSAWYRIDCLMTGEAVRASTALSAASSVEITLNKDDNTMRNPGNPTETRRVTISAVFGAGDEFHDQYDYSVVNLTYLS